MTVALAAVLGVALGAGIVSWVDRPDDAPAAAGGVDPARVAELEAAEVARSAESLEALAAFGSDLPEALTPVLTGLDAALPQVDATRVVPTAGETADWRAVVDELTTAATELPSGGTEHNMTRSGLVLTLDLLGDAIEQVAQARGADQATAEDRYASASRTRDRAVEAFGLAAMQLDLLSVQGDRGHLHLQLPAGPSGEVVDPYGH